MSLDLEQRANILEACLLVAGKPMSMTQLEGLFEHETEKPDKEQILEAIAQLQQSYENRGIELVEVASGFRLQARQSMAPWVTHMFQEKTPRYSRALMETLVLIAYRQPITRGEIEDVRGVAVSTNIIKTLLEREWVRVLGHRDVPGRPAILGTTRQFLDYFNLKRIDELPTLSEIKALDQIDPELAQEMALLDTAEAAEAEAADDSPDEAGVDVETGSEIGSEAAGLVADGGNSDFTEDVPGQLIDEVDAGIDVDHLDLDLGADQVIDGAADRPNDDPSMSETAPEDDELSAANTTDEAEDGIDTDDDSSGEFVVPAELADADSTAHEALGLIEIGGSETLH